MNILVCYKIVPDEQDVSIRSDRTVDLSKAALKIGQYDLNAVEAGVSLVEQVGGICASLTAGGAETENAKMRKGILSRGPSENFVVYAQELHNADSSMTARALAGGVKRYGDCDLVLCGEGSSDQYAQQVGIQLGELLGLPTINAVSKITPAGDGKLLVERTLEKEIEHLEVPLPAVLSVTTDINLARVPSMRDIMGAGKKPTTVWPLSEVNGGVQATSETLSMLAPEDETRKCLILDGGSSEQLEEFVKYIKSEL